MTTNEAAERLHNTLLNQGVKDGVSEAMTADLRRLAERSLADEPGTVDRLLSKEDAQAILALLDDLDADAEAMGAMGKHNTNLSRRVAALEEGLRDLWECWDTGQPDDIQDVHFQKARALLDEREGAQSRYEHAEDRAIAAESRVAALNKGLRALTDSLDDAPFPLGHKIQEAKRAARALLAAAPSEPHVGIGPVDGGRIEEWPDPAALPAEVEE